MSRRHYPTLHCKDCIVDRATEYVTLCAKHRAERDARHAAAQAAYRRRWEEADRALAS